MTYYNFFLIRQRRATGCEDAEDATEDAEDAAGAASGGDSCLNIGLLGRNLPAPEFSPGIQSESARLG